MPHKHKRKADGDDSHYNLPPTERAAPLPVGKARAPNPQPRNKKQKLTNDYGKDDTPRAFARLMAFKGRGKTRSGLDDGPKPKPKPKTQPKPSQQPTTSEAEPTDTLDSEAPPALKILPGEKLSQFSTRVDQALPLSSITKKGKKIAGLHDHRITRHEKKLKRLQDGWRKEEARLRDREQEALELAEIEQDEIETMWEDKTADLPTPHTSSSNQKKKKGKKGKRKLVVGEVDVKEEDPWEALQRNRGQRKGLHDVVQAPPTFDRVPREVFKVRDGAKVKVGNVPNKVGSLRKREELGEERQTIIETYRKMMGAKRGG